MNESKPKKKIVIHMLVRNIIQLVSFVLLPGLFIDSFNGINALIFGIKSGDMSGVGLTLLPTVLFLILTLIFGRFFCGFLCAFGTLGDILYFAGSRLFKFKFKVPEKVDRILKYLKYVILVWVLVLWIFGIETFRSANPWTAFGCMFSLPPDFSYAFTSLLAGSVILIVILIGSVFIERFFCRYLCPLGAVYSLVSRLRFVKLRKPRKSCGNCRLCTNKCKMGIPLYQTDTVKSGECINCMQCVSPCPRKNIKLKLFSKYAAPLTASVIAVAAIVLYLIGSIAIPAITAAGTANAPVKVQAEAQTSASTGGIASTDSTESSETTAPQVLNKYADGVYEGSGTGYHNGTTTVAVTIEGGLITNIEILSTRDDTSYYKRALTTISSRIIEAQDPDVDAVSGATFSSEGIIEAVADALKKAENQGGDSQPVQTSDSTEQTSAETADSEEQSEEAVTEENYDENEEYSEYMDGTYVGSGYGYHGGLTTVAVTIENGQIVDIETIEENDQPHHGQDYYSSAFNLIYSDILYYQSADVDAVSGATYSSRGIIDAVSDALSQAGR